MENIDYASNSSVRRAAGRPRLLVVPDQAPYSIEKHKPPAMPYVLPRPLTCKYCGAKLFKHETNNFCCSQGDIRLASNSVPPELQRLFLSNDAHAKNFRKYIMLYNSQFAFTSFGVKKDHTLAQRNRGIYTFKVQGQAYHYINDILPTEEQPKYIQLYFFDTEVELWLRLRGYSDLDQRVMMTLMQVMEHNPYCKFFRYLRNVGVQEESRIIIRSDPPQDQRVHNAPTASQVAAIWVEDEASSEPPRHDIVCYARSGTSHRILQYYGCYDPLHYPLLFPHGDTGWHRAIYRHDRGQWRRQDCPTFPINEILVQSVDDLVDAEQQVAISSETSKKVSCREYYCYRLQIRNDPSSVILRSGRLLQQYIVDMYIKLESTRLDYIRHNQSIIRAELYQGIVDSYNAGERRASNIGHRYILPSSFLGCERDMRSRYLNSMCVVQTFGKPDIFLTMTCSPNWSEIQWELLPVEEAQNRGELIARIFHAKLIELKTDIVTNQLFRKVAGYVYVIEFQKRGLPHVHFLIILDGEDKIRTPDQYDKFVCAEIPDESTNPHLYEAVLKHVMHGPCGAKNPKNSCMKNNTCKNRYPREFTRATTNGRNSYPIYRRRNDGKTATVRGDLLDNRWVVPYNPYLLAKYDCHLNVEVCSTVKAVKYLYKYIYKGHDRVAFRLAQENDTSADVDEITAYQNARWISPPEAAWRLFGFPLNEIRPNVVALHVHLPNMHTVTFRSSEPLQNITEDDSRTKTMLTAFFERNKIDLFARTLLYQHFPQHYVWHKSKNEKCWVPRQRGYALGRLVYANPCEGERYYLRLLLANVKGPCSFEDLLTVNETKYITFQEAVYKLGLLESDNSIEQCLAEASQYQLPFALRRLFVTLLIYCEPKSPKELLYKFLPALSEDFSHVSSDNQRRVFQLTIRSISSIIESMGKKFTDFDFGDIEVHDDQSENRILKDIEEELSIPISEEELTAVSLLNAEHKYAYDIIYDRIMRKRPGAFFLDGPGGTGKTFLYTALLANIRSKGLIALAVASSGIAASNIAGGRTANSRFKIPIDLDENPSSRISKQSSLAELIRVCRLIIWDEASMAKRQAIEHFDKTLRDICSKDSPFGGKIVVFGGDFRQVLPVIPKGTIQEAIDSSFVMSPLWQFLEKLHLTINMRALSDPTFSNFVLRIGEGYPPYEDGKNIKLPRSIVIREVQQPTLIEKLIDNVYSDINFGSTNINLATKRAILTPKNEDAESINSIMVSRQQGRIYEYRSFDEAVDVTTEQYPIEFLNTLHPGGLPPHLLMLKENSPIILLRNLDPTSGLCNGTRLICKSFSRNVINAEIAIGHHKGERVLIPRIPLQPSKSDKYPFNFKRKQFPIKLSFAMTINKAQGQTLDRVGIYLPRPVFSHGQLYVALSRAKKSTDITVAISTEDVSNDGWRRTKNIVCYEILQKAGII